MDPEVPPRRERKEEGTSTEKFASNNLSVQMVNGQSPTLFVIIPARASAQVFAANGITATLESW